MASRPNRKERIEELEAELANARRLLAVAPFPLTEDELIVDVPIAQAYRDEAAAVAIVRAQGNVHAALRYLGADIEHMKLERIRELGKHVFGNDRVQKLLLASAGGEIDAKQRIMKKQMDLAIYGNDETSTRAAQFLANVFGWYAPKKVDVKSQNISIHQLMQDPSALETFVGGLVEPGAPIAVSDGRDETRALQQGNVIEIERD